MSSTPEISDDDENHELDLILNSQPKTNASETVLISSDDETEAIEDCLTSDEDFELPKVEVQRQKDKIVKNIFSLSKSRSGQTNLESKPSVSYNVPSEIAALRLSPEKSELHKVAPGHVRMIGGVKVDFPVLPYGAQIALMAKVIEGISKGLNCLLESPTGSGKTLALLCGALAWQRHERNRIGNFQIQHYLEQNPENEVRGCAETNNGLPSSASISPEKLFTRSAFGERSIYDCPNSNNCKDDTSPVAGSKRQEPDKELDEDSPQTGLVSIHKRRRVHDEVGGSKTTPEAHTPEKQTDGTQQAETPKNIRVPTIYYGARTHKQIQQVVKEFSRTVYCGDAKMTILSSRDYSCIREFDRKLYVNKNDMCRECVMKVKGLRVDDSIRPQSTNCKYYENRKELNHAALPPSFDLEELVATGREKGACPYYAARMMVTGAQIVFCPYNYLIDPGIRSSLQIEVRDEIVILDEAHNIEDVCRESATFGFSRDQIQGALTELEKVAQYQYSNQDIMADVMFLVQAFKNWNEWFGNQTPLVMNRPVNNNEAVFTWQVDHFVNTLNIHNIGFSTYPEFRGSAEVFCRKLRDDPHSLFGVSQSTGSLVETISTVLGYLFREDCKFMDDFKPALIRNVFHNVENQPDSRGWRSTQFDKSVEKDVLSLRLLCMNPGVVFSALLSARCVLLSSGTLTPLVSLHSELGTRFPLQVSPNHVIPPDRVWIGTLTSCPNGMPLECKSQSTAQAETQDALGAAVLWTSQVTPHGVLCFLPSYPLMNKLHKRWRETGLWNKLSDIKNVFMESRNVRDHGEIMEEYYKCVNTVKGALLFAVYRGKVSEGMDFKDHQARAVITVGIPYPNMFDMMVKEKMLYNDRHAADRQLLPSSEWLRVQAYRALNQAVGRCVRHRGDWGAVLMVDARLSQPYYTEHLSKWVRAMLGDNHHTFESLVNSPNSLESFMQAMTMKENEEDPL